MRSVSIILIAPQMGENIGAAARAMKNFDLDDLRIVNPRDGWPNEKAISMSVGALNIINEAKIFSNVPEAISDLNYIYATTAKTRDLNKEYVLSRNLKSDLPPRGKIGIMFGRENSGLDNQEVSYANKILTIDTSMNFTSLNLAQAVAIVCNEIFNSHEEVKNALKQTLATGVEYEYFYNHLFDLLDEKKFFQTTQKKQYMSLKIRNIFARIDNLTQSELQTLRGIITTLAKN